MPCKNGNKQEVGVISHSKQANICFSTFTIRIIHWFYFIHLNDPAHSQLTYYRATLQWSKGYLSKVTKFGWFFYNILNSLWPNVAKWHQRSGSILAQVMTLCPEAPSHFISSFNGLVQERRNSSALAMELRLSCINPSHWLHPRVWYIHT